MLVSRLLGGAHTHSYIHTHTQHTSTLITHSDKIKDAVIAKIAMQASDLYADAYSNMLVGSVKQQWDKVGQSSVELHIQYEQSSNGFLLDCMHLFQRFLGVQKHQIW